MGNSERIPTDGGQGFGHNPFGALSSEGLPLGQESPPADSGQRSEPGPARKNRGRVDIIRQKAGRGGKTVTVIKGFVGIGLPEKEQLAKAMQKACADADILAGLDLTPYAESLKSCTLWCATETATREQIERLVEVLARIPSIG